MLAEFTFIFTAFCADSSTSTVSADSSSNVTSQASHVKTCVAQPNGWSAVVN